MEAQVKKALSANWKPWLKRPFYAFMVSLFSGGHSVKMFSRIGLPAWRLKYIASVGGEWYYADELYEQNREEVLRWLKRHAISELTDTVDQLYSKGKKKIIILSREPNKNPQKKLQEFFSIIQEVTTYIWAAHILEHILLPILREKVKALGMRDPEKYIGDAAFPIKRNAFEKMIAEYKKGVNVIPLTKEYGWMRVRDGFARPYTEKEITEALEESRHAKKHRYPPVPPALKNLFKEAQELVYFRTQRTDVFYELLYLARPIIKATGVKLGIPYSQLKYYTIDSLIKGRPKKFSKKFSAIGIDEKMHFFDYPVFEEGILYGTSQVTGNTAQVGKAKGIVKIVMKVHELAKVHDNDILVTYMTSPAFLPAMKRAAAFVTDEGGLTCHAAIVAREMKKPCIIATKNATRVFKDGDIVEVDATNGTVKKIG